MELYFLAFVSVVGAFRTVALSQGIAGRNCGTSELLPTGNEILAPLPMGGGACRKINRTYADSQ